MKNNKVIEEYVALERVKHIGVLIFTLFIVFGMFWWITPNTGDVRDVKGVVIRLLGVPSEQGNRLSMIVRLDSGVNVRVRIVSTAVFREGKRVKLKEQQPRTIGWPTYHFRGYDDVE